jgi:putative endonuclease
MYSVYILRTSSDTLYIGQTKDLEKRLQTHKKKTGASAKYLRYFTSFSLVYTESQETRSDALKREAALKRLTRAQKEALITRYASECTK